MRKTHMSVSGLSTLLALALALWEFFFFFYSNGSIATKVDDTLGIFSANRLGFNLAWLTFIYLSYQLISIPFALPTAGHRFMGVVDGMASLVPLVLALVVMFGKPKLLAGPGRWEAAILLACVSAADLFGGYAFTIALSRRVFDVTGASSSS
jgi:hypothetical protein